MNKNFRVVYAKSGQINYDYFDNYEDAVLDFNKKREADRLNIFDDRFVIQVESGNGEIVHPKPKR